MLKDKCRGEKEESRVSLGKRREKGNYRKEWGCRKGERTVSTRSEGQGPRWMNVPGRPLTSTLRTGRSSRFKFPGLGLIFVGMGRVLRSGKCRRRCVQDNVPWRSVQAPEEEVGFEESKAKQNKTARGNSGFAFSPKEENPSFTGPFKNKRLKAPAPGPVLLPLLLCFASVVKGGRQYFHPASLQSNCWTWVYLPLPL